MEQEPLISGDFSFNLGHIAVHYARRDPMFPRALRAEVSVGDYYD